MNNLLLYTLLVSVVIGHSASLDKPGRPDPSELLSKVQQLLRVDDKADLVPGSFRTTLAERAHLSTTSIVLISVGGVLILLIAYLIYRYKKWVPKTRSVSRPVSPTGGTSPSAVERQNLLAAGAGSPSSPSRNATIAR
jgi:hypothetical protein